MPELKIVTLYETNHRDPVATLRRIADEIEAGTFGAVGCIGVVIMADQLHVFGAGIDSDAPSVVCVLQAGVGALLDTIVHHGRTKIAPE